VSDITFARSRHEYDSYTDFWRLIELSGYPLIYVDEIDPDSDHCYIFSPNNGETKAGWPGARARIIFYQLEWETHPNDSGPLPPGVAEKWTHDRWHAERIGARYVPIGSHPDLRYTLTAQIEGWQNYHTALMAYLGPPRRLRIHDQLIGRGLRLAPNAWGVERHHILTHSRSMLHIHQHDGIPGVASLRVALAAAYSLPYLSEQVADRGIFSHSNMLFSDYPHLADFAHTWLCRNESRILEDYGRALYQLLCVDKTFHKCIEAAL